MKPINALVVAIVGGLVTFAAQNTFFPPRAYASAFVIPRGPDWREQMLERDPGAAAVDHALSHLTAKLVLSPDQVTKFRPLLEQRHQRILTLLLTAPPSLTRDQFLIERHEISARTRQQLNALLGADQLELVKESMRADARPVGEAGYLFPA